MSFAKPCWRMSSSSLEQPSKNICLLPRYPPFAYSLPAYPSGLLPQYGQPQPLSRHQQGLHYEDGALFVAGERDKPRQTEVIPRWVHRQLPSHAARNALARPCVHSVEVELLSATDLTRALAYCCGHCGKIKVTTSGITNGAKALTRSQYSLSPASLFLYTEMQLNLILGPTDSSSHLYRHPLPDITPRSIF